MSSSHLPLAVLDDYQHVALRLADWAPLRDRVHVTVFDDTLHDEDALVDRLLPFAVICTMRERTKFPASVLDRLPNLKLLTTTGMQNRSIDVDHARAKGIFVSGTGGKGNSTLEHIWALILATVRYVAVEHANVRADNPQWQTHVPLALSGRTLGLVGAGNLGAATAKVICTCSA